MTKLETYLQEVKARVGQNIQFFGSRAGKVHHSHLKTDVEILLAMVEKAVTVLDYITDEANGKKECHIMACVALVDVIDFIPDTKEGEL